MSIKNQDIICDPCIDSLRRVFKHHDDELARKYINIDDFSERQLIKCVVCYKCDQLIWDGEDCWQGKNNCKPCNDGNDYSRTFAQG